MFSAIPLSICIHDSVWVFVFLTFGSRFHMGSLIFPLIFAIPLLFAFSVLCDDFSDLCSQFHLGLCVPKLWFAIPSGFVYIASDFRDSSLARLLCSFRWVWYVFFAIHDSGRWSLWFEVWIGAIGMGRMMKTKGRRVFLLIRWFERAMRYKHRLCSDMFFIGYLADYVYDQIWVYVLIWFDFI